jgi:ubiquinone/menaquinone biosynthesis C-methylase UbiE
MSSQVYAEALPFPDAHFDHVACLAALLYFKDPAAAMTEIRRVLKPNGHLVLRTINRRNFRSLVTGKPLDPAAHNQFSPSELADFVSRSGFRVRQVRTYGFWPPFATNLWWYLSNCWVPLRIHPILSVLTPPQYRVTTTIFAERDGETARSQPRRSAPAVPSEV